MMLLVTRILSFCFLSGLTEASPFLIRHVTSSMSSLGRDVNLTEVSFTYEFSGEAPTVRWPKYGDHPNFTTWIQTWPGFNGINYGKAFIQGRNVPKGGLSSFGNGDCVIHTPDGYFRTSFEIFGQIDRSENKHLSFLMLPLNFTRSPPSELIANAGDDLTIEWEFSFELVTDFPEANDIMIFVSKASIKSENGHVSQDYLILYTTIDIGENDEKPNRYVVDVLEENSDGRKTVKITLTIKDLAEEDMAWYGVSVKRFEHTDCTTNLIVNPYDSFIPKDTPLLLFGSCYSYNAKENSSYVALPLGQYECFRCFAVGEGITSITMRKDRNVIKSSGEDLVYLNYKTYDYIDYWYEISNVAEGDAGEISCTVEKQSDGTVVTSKLDVVIYQEVWVTLDYNNWNEDDLNLTCRVSGSPEPTIDVWMRDEYDYNNMDWDNYPVFDFDAEPSLLNDVHTSTTILYNNGTNIEMQINIQRPKGELSNKVILCRGENQYSSQFQEFHASYNYYEKK